MTLQLAFAAIIGHDECMQPSPGKRAVTKRNTRRAIRHAAMGLFLERGFDAVTTTEVAEAAGVSPATLFNYFDTKEDLFFGQIRELERRLTGLVEACRPGDSILRALQSNVLWELTAGRSETEPSAVAPFHGQVSISARLQAREHEMYDRREIVLGEALREALPNEPLRARVVAHLYVAAEKLVAAELREQLARGPAERALEEITEFIDAVFDVLGAGVGELPAHGVTAHAQS
jgi:AcrR family transcriptional regulator